MLLTEESKAFSENMFLQEPRVPVNLLLVGWSLGSCFALLAASLLAVSGVYLDTVVVSLDPRIGFPSAVSDSSLRL